MLYGAAAFLIGLLVTAGLALITIDQPPYLAIRACFIASAALSLFVVAYWATKSDEPQWLRVALSLIAGATVMVVIPETLRWLSEREGRGVGVVSGVPTSLEHEGPTLLEKARRHRLRKDLNQYLMQGIPLRDFFRITLQPTVNAQGERVDPSEKLGRYSLMIAEWNSELAFYIRSRLGDEALTHFMNKTPATSYPSNIGDLGGLSQTWDTVTSNIAKIEMLFDRLPDYPGGAQAAATIEQQWVEGAVEWTQTAETEAGKHTVTLEIRALRNLANPIFEVDYTVHSFSTPDISWAEGRPFLVGRQYRPTRGTHHFELFQEWHSGHGEIRVVASSENPFDVRAVRVREW